MANTTAQEAQTMQRNPRTKYVAVAPDGTKVTRSTHRLYTHAVLVGPDARGKGWGAWSFNGRLDLAIREHERASKAWRGEAEVVLVECTREDLLAPASKRTSTKAAPAATNGKEPTVATSTKQGEKKQGGRAKAPQLTAAQAKAELKKHKGDYDAYQVARAEAREGKAGAAERQEKHRPGYTAYKRAYGNPALVAERLKAREKRQAEQAAKPATSGKGTSGKKASGGKA